MASACPTPPDESVIPPTQHGCIGAINLGPHSQIQGSVVAGDVSVYQAAPLVPAPLGSERLDEISNSLKAMLQFKYRKMQIPKQPWLEDWELPLKDYFVDLTMTHKTDKSHQRKSDAVRLQDIFRPKGNIAPGRILIEGPAGFGKTTLAHKLCFDFGHEEDYVKHFEQIVLIPLREFEGTLEQMILKVLNCQDCTPEEILQLLERKQSTVAFIFDGFDELSHDKQQYLIPLLKCEKYARSTVIVTSRLGSIPLENKDASFSDVLHCYDARIEIKGVTGKSRIQLLDSYLSRYPESQINSIKEMLRSKFGFDFNDRSAFSNLFNKLKRLIIPLQADSALFDCPLFLLMLFTLALKTDVKEIKGKADLYKALFNFVVQRSLAKILKPDGEVDLFHFDAEKPPFYVFLIIRFGELALEALVAKRLIISQETIEQHFGEDKTFLTLGFLTQNSSVEGVTQKSWFEPVHLSLLEFAAAYYLFFNPSMPLVTKLCEELPSFFLEKTDSLVFSFYQGLIGKEASGKQQIIELSRSLSQTQTLPDSTLLVHYLVNIATEMEIDSISTVTQVLKALFNFAVCRSLRKATETNKPVDLFQFDKENPPKHASLLRQFGKLAFEALISESHYISKESYDNDFESYDDAYIVLEFGFLTQIETSEHYRALDVRLLEFAAAYYAWFARTCGTALESYSVIILISRMNPDDPPKTNIRNFFLELCEKFRSSEKFFYELFEYWWD